MNKGLAVTVARLEQDVRDWNLLANERQREIESMQARIEELEAALEHSGSEKGISQSSINN